MEKLAVLVLVVCSLYAFQPLLCTSLESPRNTICVYGTGAQSECDGDLNQTDCHTLDALPQLLSSNTTVHFCSKHVILSNELSFTDLRDITFEGVPSHTHIKCQSQNAGFKFVRSVNLNFSNLVINGCGVKQSSTSGSIMNSNTTEPFSTALFILNCSNVAMCDVAIKSSRGTGVSFFDTNGNNNFTHCTFAENAAVEPLPGGSGVYIEFTYCTPGVRGDCPQTTPKNNRDSLYNFNGCTFSNNKASNSNLRDWDFPAKTNFLGLGRGGGLSVFFKGAAAGNTVTLSGCMFKENIATLSGGGLYATFQDSPHNNTFIVLDSVFQQNGDSSANGGGFTGGFPFFSEPPSGNLMYFRNCCFSENVGSYGGGMVIYSSKSELTDLHNEMEFHNCTWMTNTALFGSAVDVLAEKSDALSNGFLPTPVFDDCVFVDNYKADEDINKVSAQLGRGAFIVTGFTVEFRNVSLFRNNSGSAIYATTSILLFSEGSRATFDSNTGWEGGAVSLIGLSAIHVTDNCSLVFEKNSCNNKGGAISFFSTDKHDYVSSHSCFIQYIGNSTVEDRKVTISFVQNQAGLKDTTNGKNTHDVNNYGHSIHATSLEPCIYACNTEQNTNRTFEETFNCIGNVSFSHIQRKYEVSTTGGSISITNSTMLPLTVVPGKETHLPIQALDDYNHEVSSGYRVRVDSNNPNFTIQVNNAYNFITNKLIRLEGVPGAMGVLVLTEVGFREIRLSVNITIGQCTPGYVLQNSVCICSLNTELRYLGVYSCNETVLSVMVQRGFWFGYDFPKVVLASDASFVSGYCPPGYCFNYSERARLHVLPTEASVQLLDSAVCGAANRSGIVCGQCVANHSVFYHSQFLGCMPNELCNIGWLFYILAELVPVTILFLIVIFFNISFTSGAVNGFIFYAQMLDSLASVIGSDFVLYRDSVYIGHRVHQIIYSIFNLDFFNINELSFCLWKGATSLDILTFKFVTVLFAFCLVLLTIWVMNACNLYRRCRCLREGSTKSSVIHGLSAFLVICYAQCVKTSFQILTSTKLYEKGYTPTRSVVYWQGNIDHLQGRHLFYAIPAIICLLTIVTVPPLALIAYPICYKFTAFFKFSENNKILKFFSISKLKPLLDSFQSCFKDEYRFFAGLHFLYRVTLLASSYASSLTTTYTILQAQLFAIFMIHAIAQPYKERWHNIVDSLMLFTLALVYTTTQYSYITSNFILQTESVVKIVSSIEHVLIYFPLVYVLGYSLYCIVHKLKGHTCGEKAEQASMAEPWANDELPDRLLHERGSEEDYRSFGGYTEEPNGSSIDYTN